MAEYNPWSYSSKNNNPLFNNKTFLTNIYEVLSKNRGRALTKMETTAIQNQMTEIDPRIFENRSNKEIFGLLITHFTDFLNSMSSNCSQSTIDMHEVIKDMLGLPSDVVSTNDVKSNASRNFADQISASLSQNSNLISFLGVQSLDDLLKVISPSLVEKSTYISLDTRYRKLDNDGTTFFSWSVIPDTSSQQGGFNLVGNIKDITQIEVLPLRIPYTDSANNIQTYKRITMLIKEISQGYFTQESTQHQFVFTPSLDGRYIDLLPQPYSNGSVIEFANPISSLSTLTIYFYSPFEPIIFDADRMNFTISDYITDNRIHFTAIDSHNLQTGDIVYISNFTTANPTSNAIILSAVNNQYGNTITYESDTSFYINVDANSVYALGDGTVAVTNGSPVVTGTGTSFSTLFVANDYISISGSLYKISNVVSNTSLNLLNNFTGITNSYAYYKDNRVANLSVPIYFGSKRIIMDLALRYLQ